VRLHIRCASFLTALLIVTLEGKYTTFNSKIQAPNQANLPQYSHPDPVASNDSRPGTKRLIVKLTSEAGDANARF